MSRAPRQRIQVGIPGFDEIVHGGLRRDGSIHGGGRDGGQQDRWGRFRLRTLVERSAWSVVVATTPDSTSRRAENRENHADHQHDVGVGPRRGAGLSAGSFPRPALRTGRARLRASGSPRVHAVLAHGVEICPPR